jgi:hypothetical protein
MEAMQYADLLDGKNMSRMFKRFDVQFTVIIKTPPSDGSEATFQLTSDVTAVVTNVSMSGLSFESGIQFPIDCALILGITVALKPFELPIIIRHSETLERPGRCVYSCGGAYTKSDATTAFIPTLAKYLNARGLLGK